MSEYIIEGGTIVNEGRSFEGFVIVKEERIVAVSEGHFRGDFRGDRIDATGMLVLPGIIDDQVHFREPGLTWKADIASESAAAAAGGVTSWMDMPNTDPPTTGLVELEKKYEKASQDSAVNYSFYLGATNDNFETVAGIDPKLVCGVKVFMGSSTGNMLVDDRYALSRIFAESPVIVAAHCEDEKMIRAALQEYASRYGEDITADMHPLIRSAEACYRSSAQAIELADSYGTNFHLLHVSTAREMSLLNEGPIDGKKITAEVCTHHLWFTDSDYERLGNLIKWNPAVKSAGDREALREAVRNGKIDVIATDHAPHTVEEKSRPYLQCPSGGPMVQHSLPLMLDMVKEGIFTVETVVDKICHAPARRFSIKDRGFLRGGYFADIAIVEPGAEWTVGKKNLLYKCGWSPLEEQVLNHRVRRTIVNGKTVYSNGEVVPGIRGRRLEFDR